MNDGEPAIPYHPKDHPAHLRATDEQREDIAQVIQAAVSDGRLSMSEVDARLAAVYAAKTHGDLVAVTQDLLDWRVAPPPPPPAPAGYYVIPGPPSGVSSRKITPAVLLCFFVGVFGVHRFYAGKFGSGVAMLVLTLTLFGVVITGIWALVDLITLAVGAFRDGDGRPIRDWT